MKNYSSRYFLNKYFIFVVYMYNIYLPSNSELFVTSQCKNTARLRPNSLFKFSTTCSPGDCRLSIKTII